MLIRQAVPTNKSNAAGLRSSRELSSFSGVRHFWQYILKREPVGEFCYMRFSDRSLFLRVSMPYLILHESFAGLMLLIIRMTSSVLFGDVAQSLVPRQPISA
jgi:hypothetical protein